MQSNNIGDMLMRRVRMNEKPARATEKRKRNENDQNDRDETKDVFVFIVSL